MKQKILIVEDDLAISNLIRLNLNIANYETKEVYDGLEAINIIENEPFDLILLDVMLPNADGFTIMDKIRYLDIPVIFLTAKNSVIDKVTGLKLGAEDYIVKPFEALELLARIETVLRRYGKANDALEFKDIKIYLKERIVKKSGKIVDLTLKEFELLCILVQNKNIALTRDILLERVWKYDYFGGTRTVDMHIGSIRKKLDLNDNIKTVYKIGYRLED
ncbi:response regulator transcription factor [Clostridium sp. CM028]|uniref:response regulator transcription factor n=1 Tax=unclassified Clostridium TaxID=2614128 RepID=UPI001C6E04C9|nr:MULTISPECIES: response regulator transcription factor [unclassified Clostridium]MBW9145771.1 response regulator transcription factor [Clostridium sp. CM027]MBW9150609.1 response regulator transcription factor [Clostridium sp. CM028]UVE42164.1 response regulator transcription factor [Clostridium sp. CM027]WLC62772.1 response regulator transcription factor [Clostridium sp. CM028]